MINTAKSSEKCKPKPQWAIISPLSNGCHQKVCKQQICWGWIEKGRLVHWWWECKLMQLLWKRVWRSLKKLKIELPYDPANPLLGIYLKKMETLIWEPMCSPGFIAALSIVDNIWRQPKRPSTDEWVKKVWCIYLSHKKEWHSAICNNVDGRRGCCRKWNQSETTNTLVVTHVWNINNITNRNRVTDTEDKLLVSSRERDAGRGKTEGED